MALESVSPAVSLGGLLLATGIVGRSASKHDHDRQKATAIATLGLTCAAYGLRNDIAAVWTSVWGNVQDLAGNVEAGFTKASSAASNLAKRASVLTSAQDPADPVKTGFTKAFFAASDLAENASDTVPLEAESIQNTTSATFAPNLSQSGPIRRAPSFSRELYRIGYGVLFNEKTAALASATHKAVQHMWQAANDWVSSQLGLNRVLSALNTPKNVSDLTPKAREVVAEPAALFERPLASVVGDLTGRAFSAFTSFGDTSTALVTTSCPADDAMSEEIKSAIPDWLD